MKAKYQELAKVNSILPDNYYHSLKIHLFKVQKLDFPRIILSKIEPTYTQ